LYSSRAGEDFIPVNRWFICYILYDTYSFFEVPDSACINKIPVVKTRFQRVVVGVAEVEQVEIFVDMVIVPVYPVETASPTNRF
jgi:hypothetical protein